MSRFRHEHLHVSVEADRIALVKTGGRLQPGIEREKLLPVVGFDMKKPEAGLACLEAELAREEWHAASANVVLSDPLVHYFIAEPVPGIRGLDELKLLFASDFEATFGLPAGEWEICADLPPFASRFLACGANRRLLDELRRLFGATGHRLHSIQPFLVREFNQRRHRLGSDLAWFAVTERNSLTLALLSRNTWHGLRTHWTGEEGPSLLPTLLARDQVVYGISETPSRVWMAGTLPAGPVAGRLAEDVARLDQARWPGRDEQWCRDYRLALSGVWQ